MLLCLQRQCRKIHGRLRERWRTWTGTCAVTIERFRQKWFTTVMSFSFGWSRHVSIVAGPCFYPIFKKIRVGLAQFWQAPASPRFSDSLPEAPPEAGKPVVGADVQAHGMHFIIYIYIYLCSFFYTFLARRLKHLLRRVGRSFWMRLR